MKRLIVGVVITAALVVSASPAQAAVNHGKNVSHSQSVKVKNLRAIANKLPACLYDEVTDVNCYWNAKKQGNGIGSSFVVIDGVAYYL